MVTPVQKIDIYSASYPTQESDNITVDYAPMGGITLDPEYAHAVALKTASFPNSFNNIFTASSGGYTKNNVIKYITRGSPLKSVSAPGATTTTFTVYGENLGDTGFVNGDGITFYSMSNSDGSSLNPNPNGNSYTIQNLTIGGGETSFTITLAQLDTSTWPDMTEVAPGIATPTTVGDRKEVTHLVEFPASNMSLTDMFNYIYSDMAAEHFSFTIDSVARYYINFSVYLPTSSVYILLSTNGLFDVDLSDEDSISPLWGFNKLVYDYATYPNGAASQNLVDINNGVTTLILNCDLTFSTFDGNQISHAIYTYAPGVHGGRQQVAVSSLDWIPIIPKERINSIRVFITDNKGRRVSFNRENAYYGLVLNRLSGLPPPSGMHKKINRNSSESRKRKFELI